MKKIIFIFLFILLSNKSFAASSSSDSGGKNDRYKSAERLVLKAKKLEEKNKTEKALKLYSRAYDRLLKAYEKDKKNPDILNYLGFTLRKKGDFKNAEIYYLKGLELDSDHPGINEYLGELYVETNRINLAKERLEVLRGCNCEEFQELQEIIEKK
tara:strand:- start:140 stop:607 length:468 start_codon:yes stop_codon:yes gene_type:complete